MEVYEREDYVRARFRRGILSGKEFKARVLPESHLI